MRFSLRDLLSSAAEMMERATGEDLGKTDDSGADDNGADDNGADDNGADDNGTDATVGTSSTLPASTTAPAKLLNDVGALTPIR